MGGEGGDLGELAGEEEGEGGLEGGGVGVLLARPHRPPVPARRRPRVDGGEALGGGGGGLEGRGEGPGDADGADAGREEEDGGDGDGGRRRVGGGDLRQLHVRDEAGLRLTSRPTLLPAEEEDEGEEEGEEGEPEGGHCSRRAIRGIFDSLSNRSNVPNLPNGRMELFNSTG